MFAGYKREGERTLFVIPPTWRDLPRILCGRYVPKVVILPEPPSVAADPKFLFGYDGPRRGEKRDPLPWRRGLGETVAREIHIHHHAPEEREPRVPYEAIEAAEPHGAITALRNDKDQPYDLDAKHGVDLLVDPVH